MAIEWRWGWVCVHPTLEILRNGSFRTLWTVPDNFQGKHKHCPVSRVLCHQWGSWSLALWSEVVDHLTTRAKINCPFSRFDCPRSPSPFFVLRVLTNFTNRSCSFANSIIHPVILARSVRIQLLDFDRIQGSYTFPSRWKFARRFAESMTFLLLFLSFPRRFVRAVALLSSRYVIFLAFNERFWIPDTFPDAEG